MVRPRILVRKAKETLLYYVGGVYRQTYEKDIFLWAQAISFKVLITLVPIVILATGILGRILHEGSEAFARVAQLIRQYLPRGQGTQLILFIESLQKSGTFFVNLGILALAFSAMTLLTTLRVVISNIFQEPWHRQRTILGGYLFDIRMAAQVGLFFLLTVGLTIAGPLLADRIGLEYAWLQAGWRTAFKWFGLLVPYLLSIGMFFQLFYFVPKPHPPKRSALLGAVVTGLLWEIAKYGFTFYAANVGGFERYAVRSEGEESFLPALGDAFGLIIAFVFWAYYSGLVLCVGGLIAVLHEKRHRLRRLRAQAPAHPTSEPDVHAATETSVYAADEPALPVAHDASEPDLPHSTLTKSERAQL